MTTPDPALPSAALGLTLAIVESSTAPLLLLDRDLSIVAASASFFDDFKVDPNGAVGSQLFVLGAGEWNVPQLRALLEATAAGTVEVAAYEMDLKASGSPSRRLVLNARNLSYGDTANPRLLLTVTDVTGARAAEKLKAKLIKDKDDLLNEKVVLLQELQHRVANSLQIIASLILQSARKVQSEESRGLLTDAHSRVMSVAALQRHLAMSQLGDVEIRGYFNQLCASIGASMIHDPAKLSIRVEADDSLRGPHDSISLGLIVTELAINALKHAFPDGRGGKILVGFASTGPDWTLCVSDDGAGISDHGAGAKTGLGTSIVQALAQQLRAEVEVVSGGAGTSVSVYRHAAAGAPDGQIDQPVAP